MTRSRPIIASWNAGELSPEARARVADLARAGVACEILEQFIPRPLGPARKKPGTYFLGYPKYHDRRCRPLRFVWGRSEGVPQAYLLEAGDGYLRFFRDRARIAVAETDAAIPDGGFDTGISAWTSASGTGASIAYNAGADRMDLTGNGSANPARARISVATTATGVEHVLAFRVVGLAGDVLTLKLGSTAGGVEIAAARNYAAGWHLVAFTPAASPIHIEFSSELGAPVGLDDVAFLSDQPLECGAPWSPDQALACQYAQSADVMYVTQAEIWSVKIERRGNTSWSVVLVDWIDGPHYDENADDAKTLQPGATSGALVTVTASGHSPFAATDIGRAIRLKHSTTWGWGRIAEYVSATEVKVRVRRAFGGTGAVAAWQLGLFSETKGFPAAVGWAKGRLHFLGSGDRPERGDGSKTSDFENFEPGTEDDSPVSYSIGADEVGSALWLAQSGRYTLIGTPSGPFRLIGETVDGPLVPGSAQADPQNGDGASAIRPVRAGNALVHIDVAGRGLVEASYVLDADAVVGRDQSILAEHLTTPRLQLTDLAWQRRPWVSMWAIRSDGLLISCTYLREENIPAAFARHPLAGGRRAEGLACIPGVGSDELYIVTAREKGGSTVRAIELLADPLERDEPQENAYYVEYGVDYHNTPAAVLTPGAATGTGVTFTAGAGVFTADDVGMLIRHNWQDRNGKGQLFWTVGIAEITAYVSATVVTVDIKLPFPSTAPLAAGDWSLTVREISGDGLAHLEGEAVEVLADGGVQVGHVVTDGAITLDPPAAHVMIGLGYVSRLMPLPMNGGSPSGTSQTLPGRISAVSVMLDRSLGVQVGRDEASLSPVQELRTVLDLPPALVTEDREVAYPGTWTGRIQPYVHHAAPLPCTIVGLVTTVTVGDG